MYALIEEARAADLLFNWRPRLPNSRLALASAEWVRQREPQRFADFHKSLFEAHFALQEDLRKQSVIDRHAEALTIDFRSLHSALDDGQRTASCQLGELEGGRRGVSGTPAWFIERSSLLPGLPDSSEFNRLASYVLDQR